jgi:hypothetical protein
MVIVEIGTSIVRRALARKAQTTAEQCVLRPQTLAIH